VSLQGEILYVIIWIVMLVVPIITGIQRFWAAAVIFLIGSVIFSLSYFKANNGWNDLANFATLLVVVLPIYLAGTIVWIWSVQRRKRNK
jgi:hypothetical protein